MAPLSRDGPGLLLRDVLGGDDPQVAAALDLIAAERPDILLLGNCDWDGDGAALAALQAALAARGVPLPFGFAPEPNAGRATGRDLDGDGRAGGPRDAEGFGRFAGDGGLALLARWPVALERDLTVLPWDGPLGPPPGAAPRRLSSTGHWLAGVAAPGGAVTVMAFAATAPVFDGPEDLNGRRNADEVALWSRLLAGDPALGAPPAGRFVLMGLANLDPADGEGRREALAALLADPRLQDPRPASEGGRAAADPGQRGDPALDTADWPGAGEGDGGGPGNLRVTYVLPSADWAVAGSGVLWPAPGEPLAAAAAAAGPHRLVWADLR